MKVKIIRSTIVGTDENGHGVHAAVGEEVEVEDLVAYRLMTCKKAVAVDEEDAKPLKKKMSAKQQTALVGTSTAKV